jgi:NAD-dependent SIR2 family protein deacetylase
MLTEDVEKSLDATKPYCQGCKKVGSINHALTVAKQIKKKWVWFNERCLDKYEANSRRRKDRARKNTTE